MKPLELLFGRPWPWWVTGILVGLVVPMLLLWGNRMFGISSSFRHICAATIPGRSPYLNYDWRRAGAWNLVFVLGLLVGGWLTVQVLSPTGEPDAHITAGARASIAADGIEDFDGLVPDDLFSWGELGGGPGLVLLLGGGFLVGFGTRWAGGCTSGHAISGLAARQLPSLIAVVGFFVGGLLVTHFVLPWLLGGGR